MRGASCPSTFGKVNSGLDELMLDCDVFLDDPREKREIRNEETVKCFFLII